ncbi:MAG: LTA synthase family protein, partial [Pseudomonadota bacterium]
LLQQTILMTALTLCKFTYLYYNTGKPSSMLAASLRTTALLLLIYTLLNLVLARRWFVLRLAVHETIALMVISDLLYFRYFDILPSISDLQFIKILPEIKGSIFSMIPLKYLALFIDAVPIAIHHYCMKNIQRANEPKLMTSVAAAALILFIVVFDFSNADLQSAGQAYGSYGLLHYHISQVPGILKVEEEKSSHYVKGDKPEVPAKAARLCGIARGRNVIVIQVEALQDFVINRKYNGQTLTPNLNKLLLSDTIYFNRFYQQLGKGGTSDAEFVTQNSMYPSMDLPAYSKYQDNKFLGLPMILRGKGFNTMAFHAYKPEFWNRQNIYPMLGYDRFINMNDFDREEILGWGLSDKLFFKQSSVILSRARQPFYSFLVTLSSHHPYALPAKYKKIKLLSEHKDKALGKYLQAINYADEAIGIFIEELKKYGLYDNSIIAVYGDHRGIPSGVVENDKLMAGMLGHEYTFDESLNVPLIIHIPGTNINETNMTVGGQMDFLPTMLNLLGIKESRIRLFGQDLLNAESGFVASQSNMVKGSFIDDYKIFVMSRDGVFEHGKAWDLSSRQPVDLELCRDGYERSIREIKESDYILANDLIREFVTLGEADAAFADTYRAIGDFMDRIVRMFNRIVK